MVGGGIEVWQGAVVADVDFSDVKAATAWFETQTPEMRCVMSSRAALRVAANLRHEDAELERQIVLTCFWAVLTSAGRGFGRSEDVDALKTAASTFSAASSSPLSAAFSAADPADEGAARSAFSSTSYHIYTSSYSSAESAADSAFVSADDSAASGASVGFSAHSARSADAYTAVSNDSEVPWAELRRVPLWHGVPVPEHIAQAHAAFLTYLGSDPDWAFFRRFYAQMWEGTFTDWDLAIEVATLDPELWEGEDALCKVAEAIRGIEARLKTRVGPSLVKNAAGKWDIEDDVTLPAEPMAFAIGQVEIALEAALAKQGNNVFSEDASEAQMISIALSRHRDHHSLVATSFWNACMGLERNIGDLYPDESSLISLRNVLYTSVEEMCAQDDLVRDRIARLAALETRRYPTADEIEQLKTVPEAVSEDMTERANAELADAIDVVTTTEKPPRIWRARLVNWINTLGRGIEQGQKAEKKAAWLLKLGRSIAGWFFGEDDGDE